MLRIWTTKGKRYTYLKDNSMDKKIVFYGSEFPEIVSVEPIDGLTMDDYDFECEFYCYTNRKVKFTKLQMQRVDENHYEITIDSTKLGCGVVKCDITLMLPDTYAGDDWLRKTVWRGETDTIIKR